MFPPVAKVAKMSLTSGRKKAKMRVIEMREKVKRSFAGTFGFVFIAVILQNSADSISVFTL